MSPRPEPSSARLDARYGRASRRGTVVGVVVAALVLVVLAIAWFLWARPIDTGPQIQWLDRGFEVRSEGEIAASFLVTLDAGHSARCAVEARNADFAIVGWKLVDVPASADRSRTFTVDLRSTQPAVAAAVNSCWILAS